MFTVSENMRMQDTWFLLVISAIVANLQYVGDSTGFDKPQVHGNPLPHG
jgi:hypothetical protein